MTRPYRRIPKAIIPYLPDLADGYKHLHPSCSPYKMLGEGLGVHPKAVEYQILRERKRISEVRDSKFGSNSETETFTSPPVAGD